MNTTREDEIATDAVEPPELATDDESRLEERSDGDATLLTPKVNDSARRNDAEESYGDEDWDES